MFAVLMTVMSAWSFSEENWLSSIIIFWLPLGLFGRMKITVISEFHIVKHTTDFALPDHRVS